MTDRLEVIHPDAGVSSSEKWLSEAARAIADGKAVQCYGTYVGAYEWAAKVPGAEVWYTERNGDCIRMLVPAGTTQDRFPTIAMQYQALHWERP